MPNLRIIHPIRKCLRAVQEQGENVENTMQKNKQPISFFFKAELQGNLGVSEENADAANRENKSSGICMTWCTGRE